MLLARKNSAFSHPFVRAHARRASLYMLVFLAIFLVFHFLQPYLANIVFLKISLIQIFLFCYNILFFGLLLFSSYRAYVGHADSDVLHLEDASRQSVLLEGTYTEEQKFQIMASFLLIFGIFSSQKSTLEEVKIGRKIGNFFLFGILFFAALTKSFITFPVILLVLAYVAVFVSTSVFLMMQNKFLSLAWYHYVPTYHELEARIYATFSMIKEFFQVAFGKEKTKNFTSEYHAFLQKYSQKIAFQEKFWTHSALIGIPIVNLITLPSFFQQKYHEYQGNIAEGFFLTIFSLLLYFFSVNIFLLYILIFPIATLLAEARNNSNIRAPFTSLARNVFIFAYKTKQKIHTLQESKTEKTIVIGTSESSGIGEKNENNSEKNLADAIKNI